MDSYVLELAISFSARHKAHFQMAFMVYFAFWEYYVA
jgi:hypothetical protein